MPGPYCEVEDVYRQTQARLGQAADSELPSHWGPLGTRSVQRGHARLIGILGGRGYSVAAIDSWSGREIYNLDYAVAYAFMYGGFRKGDDAPSPKTELERIDKELKDKDFLLFDDSGSLILPDIDAAVGSNQVSYGRSQPFDDDAADVAAWKAGYVDDDGTAYEVTNR